VEELHLSDSDDGIRSSMYVEFSGHGRMGTEYLAVVNRTFPATSKYMYQGHGPAWAACQG